MEEYALNCDIASAERLVNAFDAYAIERFGLDTRQGMLKRTTSVRLSNGEWSTLGEETRKIVGVSYSFFETLKIRWGLPMITTPR